MYADRYEGRTRLDPGGMAFALGASALVVFGLTLSAPNFIPDLEKHLVVRNIELPKDPPPREKPKPQIKDLKPVTTPPIEHVDVTPPPFRIESAGIVAPHFDPVLPLTETVGTGGDVGTLPPHNPVVLGPQLDPRYMDYFQPNYPSDERLAGHEGRVVVRVLIGTDGRVKDVQQVSAASTAFFEATRKQALAKWRFKPGTRDGEAVEAWHTMAVRFVLDEG